MMQSYPKAYKVKEEDLQQPDEGTITAVLGKRHDAESQYSDDEQSYFDAYHARFKLASKPTWHLRALAYMEDDDLLRDMPEVLERMFDEIDSRLETLSE